MWSSIGCRWPKSHTVTGHGNPAGPAGTGGEGNKKGELTPPGSKNVVPVGSCDPTGASSRIGARHALVPAGIGRPFGCRLPDAVPLLGGVVRPHGDGRFGTLRFANDGGWTSEPPDSWTGLVTDRTGDPEPALHDGRAGTGFYGTGTVMITCVPHPHRSHPPSQGCLWTWGRRWQPAPPPLHVQPVQGLTLQPHDADPVGAATVRFGSFRNLHARPHPRPVFTVWRRLERSSNLGPRGSLRFIRGRNHPDYFTRLGAPSGAPLAADSKFALPTGATLPEEPVNPASDAPMRTSARARAFEGPPPPAGDDLSPVTRDYPQGDPDPPQWVTDHLCSFNEPTATVRPFGRTAHGKFFTGLFTSRMGPEDRKAGQPVAGQWRIRPRASYSPSPSGPRRPGVDNFF